MKKILKGIGFVFVVLIAVVLTIVCMDGTFLCDVLMPDNKEKK